MARACTRIHLIETKKAIQARFFEKEEKIGIFSEYGTV